MDGGDRQAGQGGGIGCWQVQDHRTDRRLIDDAVPMEFPWLTDLRMRVVSHGAGRNPDVVVGDPIFARCPPGTRRKFLIQTASLTREGRTLQLRPLHRRPAGIAQLVERNLAKVEVASSSLVSRSSLP